MFTCNILGNNDEEVNNNFYVDLITTKSMALIKYLFKIIRVFKKKHENHKNIFIRIPKKFMLKIISSQFTPLDKTQVKNFNLLH